jgi:hypothetical protein
LPFWLIAFRLPFFLGFGVLFVIFKLAQKQFFAKEFLMIVPAGKE